MNEKFQAATRFLLDSKGHKLSNQQKLKLYGLYKTATEGQVKIPKPSKFNLLERAKYDAWKSVEHLSKDECMTQYLDIVDAAFENWYKPKPKL